MQFPSALPLLFMSDNTKLLIHFLVSKLVILAVPLLNQVLSAFGITVNTSNSTVDALANCICIALGLAYSYWVKTEAQRVHTKAGYVNGLVQGLANTVNDRDPIPNPISDPAKIVPSVLEIPFNKPAASTRPVDLNEK